MWPYWLMFLLPAGAALGVEGKNRSATLNIEPAHLNGVWSMVCLVLALLIGYRFEVGADWETYFRFLSDVEGLDILEVLGKSDPAYYLLNWVSDEVGGSIYLVNLIGGGIFVPVNCVLSEPASAMVGSRRCYALPGNRGSDGIHASRHRIRVRNVGTRRAKQRIYALVCVLGGNGYPIP